VKILLLDTTIAGIACAVVDLRYDERTIEGIQISPEVGGSAQRLPELFAKALSVHGLQSLAKEPLNLSGIVVGQGPGSFTGTRVGLSFVAGLRAAIPGIKILGVDALACATQWLGTLAVNRSGPLTLILPSTRTQAFAADFSASNQSNPAPANGTGRRSRIFDLLDSQQWQQLEPPSKVVVCGDRTTLEKPAATHGIPLESVSVSDVSLAAIYGMNQCFRLLWPHRFDPSVPHAIYMRGSTVEEKLNEVKPRA
jgi:tRNA A37 threonylcarbamoyladenosine modification protein TsaB